MAQSAEDQAACQDDAFRVCSHTIPDRERTFQCMIAKKDALSARMSHGDCAIPAGRNAAKAASGPRTKKGGPINLNPAAAR